MVNWHRVRVLVLGCLALFLFSEGVSQAAAAGKVLAKGKGFVVTQDELDQLVVEQKVMLQSMRRKVSAEEEALLEKQTLERLVIKKILLKQATEEELRQGAEIVQKKVAEEITRQGSEEAYRRRVLRGGTDPEVFQQRMVGQAVADLVIQREIRSKLNVSDEQVRAFYNQGIDVQGAELEGVVARLETENKDSTFFRDATNRLALIRQTNLSRLERPEQARAVMLVLFTKNPATGELLSENVRLSKKERLQRLRQRVFDGEDFVAIAREFSEEPDAQVNNAEYLAAKEKVTLPALRNALFNLPLNELSEVIETELGYYLVKVLERPAAGKVPFEEAESSIRELLINQEMEKRLPKWFEQLKKDYEVELVAD